MDFDIDYLSCYCSVNDEMLQQLDAWRNEAADVQMSHKQPSMGHSDSGKMNLPLVTYSILSQPKMISC